MILNLMNSSFFVKIFFVGIALGFFFQASGQVILNELASNDVIKTGERPHLKKSPLILAQANTQMALVTASDPLQIALAKAASFPQEESWTLTLEQIGNMDIEQGGSDLSYYYLQAGLSMMEQIQKMDNLIQHQGPLQKKAWSKFCYKSNCSTGLDLTKINRTNLRSIVKQLSLVSPMNVFSDKDAMEESVVFLQGSLAPEGWDAWFYNKRKNGELKPSPEHIKGILKQLGVMKREGVKRIAVNLPPQLHKDPWPFFYLGEFINKEEIVLHIVGGCGHYCATYLIPAAKTVYIEPYGYIYHKGNTVGLFMETLKVFEKHRERVEKELKEEMLPEMDYKERCDFVVQSIVSSPRKFQEVMTKFFKSDWEKEMEFDQKYDKVEYETGHNSVAFWSKETAKTFVESFSHELLEDVTLVLLETDSEEDINRWNYVKRLEDVSGLEIDYYLRTKIRHVTSPSGHSYIDFLESVSSFLKDPEYVKNFAVPKLHYNIPEESKPYEWIVPSAEVLRLFGFDIRGENNKEMIDFSDFSFMQGVDKEYSSDRFLYLDKSKAKNCGFFDIDVSFANQKLEQCLLSAKAGTLY